jgi:putative transposase
MARLPRLLAPGHAHLVWLPGLSGVTLFTDDADHVAFKAALREALAAEGVQLHAYALAPHEVRLLATPAEKGALSRFVQAIGRRYVRCYNLRHRRSGTLWSGRFRCACVEPGAPLLDALRWVESAPGASSAAARRGQAGPESWVAHPAAYWALGNTPFEREQAYARLLEEGLHTARVALLENSLRGGWPYGSAAFADSLAPPPERPARPRPRGRPAGRKPG